MKEVKIHDIRELNLTEEVEPLRKEIVANGQGQCVANARLVMDRLGYPCVEGVVLIARHPEMQYIRHCWNIMEKEEGSFHFDVTREFVWDDSFQEAIYFPIAICDKEDYMNKPVEDLFCSDAPEIADKLKSSMRDQN